MEYEARILDTNGSYSLVKWEGRAFPGISIQGDSLQCPSTTTTASARPSPPPRP
ncbi:DUF6959 family protein, partial [Nocardia sp. NPDC004722]